MRWWVRPGFPNSTSSTVAEQAGSGVREARCLTNRVCSCLYEGRNPRQRSKVIPGLEHFRGDVRPLLLRRYTGHGSQKDPMGRGTDVHIHTGAPSKCNKSRRHAIQHGIQTTMRQHNKCFVVWGISKPFIDIFIFLLTFSIYFFWKTFCVFFWTRRQPMGQRSTWGLLRGEHNPPGRAWRPRRALVGCAHLGCPPDRLFAL